MSPEPSITTLLDALEVGEPLVAGPLTMEPLLRRQDQEAGYTTLDEALAQGTLRISEVSEGGRVPELLVQNDGVRPVLIADGEELVGAKQNRVVNLTILVPARTRMSMPVSCVEAGRWQHRSRHFSSSNRAFYASGRALKARAVSDSYRSSSRPISDQGAIWSDIAEKSVRFRAHSPTREMGVLYERSRSSLAEIERQLAPRPRQVGAIFVADRRLLGLELFDAAATWRKLAPKLCASYGLDAIDRAGSDRPQSSGFSVPSALERVRTLRAERYPAVGLGVDVRLSGPDLSGGALVVDGRVVHLAVFQQGV